MSRQWTKCQNWVINALLWVIAIGRSLPLYNTVLYFLSLTTNCDFIDLENDLLIWQTWHVCFMTQFKQDRKNICLSPFTTVQTFFFNLFFFKIWFHPSLAISKNTFFWSLLSCAMNLWLWCLSILKIIFQDRKATICCKTNETWLYIKKNPYNLNLVEFSCVLACFKANKQPLMWLQVSVWRGLLWFSNFLVRFLHYITVCNSQRGLSPN